MYGSEATDRDRDDLEAAAPLESPLQDGRQLAKAPRVLPQPAGSPTSEKPSQTHPAVSSPTPAYLSMKLEQGEGGRARILPVSDFPYKLSFCLSERASRSLLKGMFPFRGNSHKPIGLVFCFELGLADTGILR